MPASIAGSTTIPLLQEVIAFTEARHGVLAGNVANLDTPGYRVRDLSVEAFQDRLRAAVEARRAAGEESSPGILAQPPDDDLRRVRESMQTILFHDDSNVGIEQQVLEISKNQFMHNLAITIMTSQVRMLQSAISERV
jgi:flagellar basal-body rod protein FlgB